MASILLIVTLVAALAAVGTSLLVLMRINRPDEAPPELTARLMRLEQDVARLPSLLRDEVRGLREELQGALTRQTQTHETRFSSFSREMGEGHTRLGEVLKTSTDSFGLTQTTRLSETNQQMKDLRERLEAQALLAQKAQKELLEGVSAKIEALTVANGERQEHLRKTLAESLELLRKENDAKLEQMRATVDEKLQGTLDKRLGESFQLVSERLEQVHKGLGEMQSLATGVGDLKRVLTNVKSRGGWGEVQLGMLLEDMLTPEQYASNIAVQPGASERVEYAVRLPGKAEDGQVWLPIDAKFPHEDYDRLLAAQDVGLVEDVERAAQALERAVKLQAKTICAKYVHPPHTTDFAIMYLPTEGLFAEVIRRPGLVTELQQQHRVMVTGPTTLAAILNSLQMGFRSVAIEKRSSEVWKVLGAAKAEFSKYGTFIEKVSKQLATAQNTLEDASKRTRAVERKLREVETLDAPEAEGLLLPPLIAEDDDEAA
ncbi:DNA recombination protein RmuC [Caulobacter sp. S45]|uniref:DNA recombination protein RmuC n=1 Tax=Caulobacter sp. S45 TaxID=1641861 RepID=UPI001576D440|nr:DNA recombination protein RmuC [Caulobacter sp. S45]